MRTDRVGWGTASLRAALAAIALGSVVLVPVQPVAAHPVVEWGWPPGDRSGRIAGYAGFCVEGRVIQEHAYHQVYTSSTNCNNYVNRWMRQYQQYFKQLPGAGAQYCFDNGWHQSGGAQQVYWNHWGWDIGHWCNYSGAHVYVYVDSWQEAWTGSSWYGGAWRPATKHCHCP